ncbi:pilus assembly protein PilP [Thermodesulfovibrio yellowstonii]|jgi:type IV pilus assembly protein PilP|uniref:pilus assembly protein PilP n=2 Tax=Thermodesulfovibrionaceae TaxID=2811504 RepID=UPI000688BE84
MMNRKKILFIGIFTLFIVLLLVIYLFNNTLKHEEIVQQSVKKQSIQTNLQEITFPTYSYDAQKLRDPFAPLIVKREERKKGASPLESYDIEELKLTGVAKDKKGSLALIQAPDGRFYIVRENDRIGFSGGKVIRILKDGVEIKEDNRKLKYLKLRAEEEK